MAINNGVWFDDYVTELDDEQIDEYDITATPNDFNVLTLFSFIESGAVKIPGFQRNYVWDRPRASKLIESLIIGIPVPQLFLYEQTRNNFLVVDGQQRLMSIYYFIKQRFPKKDKRSEIRDLFDQHGGMPDEYLHNDDLFEDFKLSLGTQIPGKINKFNTLKYSTLGEYKTQLDLRPIRNIVVKQSSPSDDDSSIFELFNRLNTGGINLRPQEIRTSMYHSKFYDTLYRMNRLPAWRGFLNSQGPDLHMKDIEILLRSFAMLMEHDSYSPSMVKFLNRFSRSCKLFGDARNTYLFDLFRSFLDGCSGLPQKAFINPANSRFNIALFEAVFTAACTAPYNANELVTSPISEAQVAKIATDPAFLAAATEGTTNTANVKIRIELAKAVIS